MLLPDMLASLVSLKGLLMYRVSDLHTDSSNRQQVTASSNQTPQEPSIQYTSLLHYAPFLGIDRGHRQLIAVTCIAEHA